MTHLYQPATSEANGIQTFIPEFHFEYARFLGPLITGAIESGGGRIDTRSSRSILTKMQCYDMCGPTLDEPFGHTISEAVRYITTLPDFLTALVEIHHSITHDSVLQPRAEPCLPPDAIEWMEVRDSWITLSVLILVMRKMESLRSDQSLTIGIICSLIDEAQLAMNERYTNAARSMR